MKLGISDYELEIINAVGLLRLENSILYDEKQIYQWKQVFVKILLKNARDSSIKIIVRISHVSEI